jgi:hypothetical protein
MLQCKSTTSILNTIVGKIYEGPTNNFKLVLEIFKKIIRN